MGQESISQDGGKIDRLKPIRCEGNIKEGPTTPQPSHIPQGRKRAMTVDRKSGGKETTIMGYEHSTMTWEQKLDKLPQLALHNEFYDGLDDNIRQVVALLRQHGYNTTCSSAHDLTVDVSVTSLEEITELCDLLAEHRLNPFRIDIVISVPEDGFWDRRATISFGSTIY